MVARRTFTGGAVVGALSSGINASVTSFTLADATGWPDGANGQFMVVIDAGLSTEEKINCQSRVGTTVTVASGGRGFDGTTAASHSSGAVVKHIAGARDFDEYSQHVSDTESDPHPTKLLNNARHDTTARHGSTVVDHGSIGGLGDDDHAQYLNTTRHAAVVHTAAMLGTDSVGSDEIAAGAVGAAELASDAVTTVKILDANVTTAKVADDAVTRAKIADSEFTVRRAADTAHTLTAAVATWETVNSKAGVQAGQAVVFGKGYVECDVGALWLIELYDSTAGVTIDAIEVYLSGVGREVFTMCDSYTFPATSTVIIRAQRDGTGGVQQINDTKIVVIPVVAIG